MDKLTPGLALRLGGWSPTHARVIALEVGDDVACAVIDANGDGSHLDMEWYEHVGGAWVITDSWTDVRRADVEGLAS